MPNTTMVRESPRMIFLFFHKDKLDQERGQRWDELNRARIETLTERLLNMQTEPEENEGADDAVEDDGMDFLPTPFIPAGLDMDIGSDSSEVDSPFSPIPDSSDMGDGGEPSPFLPLTP